MNDVNEERPMFLLGPIAAFLRWLEELANLLSGPLLVAGLGIALVDLLTDGALLTAVPVLLYAWAIAQAVGVDAQLVGAWDRAKRAALRRNWWALLGLIALGAALAYVAYVAGLVFATQEANHISEAQALASLGMNATTWLWQRVGVSVFLVCLSGWTRYRAPRQTSIEDERAKLQRELELEPLRQRIRHTRLAGVRDAASALLNTPAQGDPTHITPVNTQASPADVSDDLPTASQEGAGVATPAQDATMQTSALVATGEAVNAPDSSVNTPDEPPDNEPPTPPTAPTTPRPSRRGKSSQKATAKTSSNGSNGHATGASTLTLLPLRTEREDFPSSAHTGLPTRRHAAPSDQRKSSRLEKRKAQEIAAFALLDADPQMTKTALRKALHCRQTTADGLYAQWHYGRQGARARIVSEA